MKTSRLFRFFAAPGLRAETRILLGLAIPVVLSQVSHTLVGLADTLMIGQTGDVTALAASALGNNLFSLPIVFAVGITYVLSPKISESHARGEKKACFHLLVNSALSNLLWGLAISLVLLGLLPWFDRLGQKPEVARLAVSFLRWQIWSIPGIMLFQTFRQFFDGLGQTRPGMFASVSANLLNVLLNYLLIYGNWGFPAMGLYGAAIANFVSRWIMGVLLAAFFFFSPSLAEWRSGNFLQEIRAETILLLNRLGLPVAMQFIFEVGAFSFTAVLVGRLGPTSLGAHQIVISLASVTYMMASGISAAASIRVGHFLGLENRTMIRRSGLVSFALVSVFMLFTCFIFLGLRQIIPGWFIQDPGVLRIAAELLIIAGFFQLSDGIQVVGLGCLRGLSDVTMPTLITLVAYWVVAIPLGYYLGISLGLGAAGTWWALLAGLTVSAVLMFFRFLHKSRSLTFSLKHGNVV